MLNTLAPARATDREVNRQTAHIDHKFVNEKEIEIQEIEQAQTCGRMTAGRREEMTAEEMTLIPTYLLQVRELSGIGVARRLPTEDDQGAPQYVVEQNCFRTEHDPHRLHHLPGDSRPEMIEQDRRLDAVRDRRTLREEEVQK